MVSVNSPAFSAASSSDRSDSVRATGVLLFVIPAGTRRDSRRWPTTWWTLYADLHHLMGRQLHLPHGSQALAGTGTGRTGPVGGGTVPVVRRGLTARTLATIRLVSCEATSRPGRRPGRRR